MATAESIEVSITTEAMVGVSLFDLNNAAVYNDTFMYTEGSRSEDLSVGTTSRSYLTSAYPEWYTSTAGTRAINFTVVLPWSELHLERLQALRTAVKNRRVLGYRDNRGRLHAGVVLGLDIQDTKVGSSISITFNVVNNSMVVA